VLPGAIIDEDGKQHPEPAKCQRLPHNIREVMMAFHPAYGILMLGPTDARDRVASSQLLQTGTDDQGSVVASTVDKVRQAVAVAGGRLVVLPVKCDAGSPVPGARIDRLNAALADYATKHPDVVFARQALVSCANGASQQPWTWTEVQRLLPTAQ
jgi:hypothetical protein